MVAKVECAEIKARNRREIFIYVYESVFVKKKFLRRSAP